MMEFDVDFKKFSDEWQAFDWITTRFTELQKNCEIVKSFWQQYLKQFPRKKSNVYYIYESRRYDNWCITKHQDKQLDDYYTELLDFIDTL